MRDRITGETYGAGYCVNGEPTGDETPLDDWQPAFPPAVPCRTCGTETTSARGECITCELASPCPECHGTGDHERDAPGSLYGVEVHRCGACYGTGREGAAMPDPTRRRPATVMPLHRAPARRAA